MEFCVIALVKLGESSLWSRCVIVVGFLAVSEHMTNLARFVTLYIRVQGPCKGQILNRDHRITTTIYLTGKQFPLVPRTSCRGGYVLRGATRQALLPRFFTHCYQDFASIRIFSGLVSIIDRHCPAQERFWAFCTWLSHGSSPRNREWKMKTWSVSAGMGATRK